MNLFFGKENCKVSKEIFRKAFVDKVDYSKKKAIDYRTNGKKIAFCGKECRDVFTDEYISMSSAIQTDGEFYWRSDLPHYIEKYDLELPEKLVQKIMNQGSLTKGRKSRTV